MAANRIGVYAALFGNKTDLVFIGKPITNGCVIAGGNNFIVDKSYSIKIVWMDKRLPEVRGMVAGPARPVTYTWANCNVLFCIQIKCYNAFANNR